MKKISSFLIALLASGFLFGQNVLIFQPDGGLNDGSDQGSLNGGKDTWANRFSPTTNEGAGIAALGTPRSNCNPSDYKAYFQFDVDTLPNVVDSVFFGVTHLDHTTYCFSNCDADFYFYYVTSPWDEMTLTTQTAPTDSVAFFGPKNITFPNDFQNQEYDITDAYNYWKTPDVNNYGFTIYSPTVGCNNASVFFGVYTSDDTVVAARPYLKIYYPNPVAIDPSQEESKLAVFPNPFSDYLKMNVADPKDAFFTDMLGRKFIMPYDPTIRGFNTSSLNPGMYMLHVKKENAPITVKVFKEAF